MQISLLSILHDNYGYILEIVMVFFVHFLRSDLYLGKNKTFTKYMINNLNVRGDNATIIIYAKNV